MRIYFAGVSRIVELEAWLVKQKAARLLSFYYEIDARSGNKGTKAFRVWKALKKGKFDISKLDGLFVGKTQRKGVEATQVYRDRYVRELPGLMSVFNQNREGDDNGRKEIAEKGEVRRERIKLTKKGRQQKGKG